MDALGVRRAWLRACAVLAVLLCCLIAVSAASARSRVAPRGTHYAKISRVCPAPRPGDATCLALARVPVPSAAAGEPGVRPYTAARGALESGPAGGLTPEELASAYGYDPAAGGSGQTIAIVDAYDDPKIESDLATFDAEYGVAPCTKANGCFTKVSQSGSPILLPAPDTRGWSVEIALDVEMAHSACPNCKILLVEAKNESFKNLAVAVGEAVNLGATEVSNSYGGPESLLGSAERAAYKHPGVVIAASTGDSGYDDWTLYVNEGEPVAPEQPDAPASLPSVVAVGGTTLELTASAKRSSETVWNGNGALDASGGFEEGATGGGCSTLFAAEPWQQATPGFAATGCVGKRVAADVSAVADPNTGFDIYDSYNCGIECELFGAGEGWLTIGGTSLSTPLVSSLYALAGGSNGVEYPSLTLYGHLGEKSSLFDVTKGGNGYCDDGEACGANALEGARVDCEGTTACNAAPGFDGPSGVGAPNGLNLFKPLLPIAVLTPPSSPEPGVATSFNASSSSDPYPGAVLAYSWSWGDGTAASTGVAPTHTYSAPGEYTVALTVSDSYGFKSAPATAVVNVRTHTVKEHEEEEAAAKKKAEEEAAAKKKAEEEAAKKVEEKKKAEEAAAKAEQEAAERKQDEAEAVARRDEAELTKKHEQEAAEAAANKKHEEEAAKSSVNAGSQGVNGFQMSFVPPVPDAELATTSLQVSASGAVTLKISCPAAETSCAGTVTLRTLGAVIAAGGNALSKKAAILTLTAGTFTVAGGKVHAVTLHLSSRARALLRRARTMRVRATLLAHDPRGAVHTTRTIVTLRARRSSRHKG